MNRTTDVHGQTVVERWIDVGGTSTRYLEAGRGDPVLLIPSEGCASEQWYGVLKGLADGYRVIAVDLPGYGYSEPAPGADPAAMAAFAWKFARAVRAERPVVVGHSFGGAVAVNMALQQPGSVPSLVLVSPAGMGRAINPAKLVLAVTPLGDLTKWLVPRLPFGPRLLVTAVAAVGSCRPWRIPSPWWSSQVKAVSSPGALSMTLRSQRTSVGPLGQKNLLLRQLPELPMPTLVAWGLQDVLVPFWQGIVARRRLRDGRLKLVPRAGHLVPMEAADELLRAVRPFLARSRGVTSGGQTPVRTV
ncbi:alpha/beta fold hydrolase [Streptomyces sp. TRM 70351]|uniref:alpha/beta fold hydrolase n=1 Tax=Streptomyces sp. TRM 70351 TaxID=3116552 RepID=UPI002E7AB44A|nr:alpha/beta fold hydrolase [Streptomyces sp. TRM 70351]MEE1928833.1 alpha/beta fold hydrolase [Streptomyces sp. TRM 70351]